MRKYILLILLLVPCIAYGQAKKQLDSDSDGAIDLSLGGLGVSLSDPGADRLLFWDDSNTDIGWLLLDTELSIVGTTLSISNDSITESMFDSTNSPTDNYVLSYDSGTGGFTWIVGAGGLGNVVEDLTPELGGNLDIGAFSIEGVDATEFGYVDGVTSDIQTQINAKEGTLTNEAGLYSALSDVTLFLEDLIDDTTPQLGGSLDLNAQTVTDATGVNDDDCTGQQGNYWWDSTDNQWEFCNLDSGTPITIGGVDEGANYNWTGSHTFANGIVSSASNNPYLLLDEDGGTDFVVGTYDTTTDRLEVRTSTTVNTDVLAYFDTNGLTVNGAIKGNVYTATASKGVNYTIGTDDARECWGGVIYVTAAVDITACDDLAAGTSFTVIALGANTIDVDVQADDRMYLDAVALNDGDKATSTGDSGDLITCTYESAAGWYCASGAIDGANWTDGG